MRDLATIEADYMFFRILPEPRRTQGLVSLMNELERDYGAFIIDPTPADMRKKDIQLYRKISDARNL